MFRTTHQNTSHQHNHNTDNFNFPNISSKEQDKQYKDNLPIWDNIHLSNHKNMCRFVKSNSIQKSIIKYMHYLEVSMDKNNFYKCMLKCMFNIVKSYNVGIELGAMKDPGRNSLGIIELKRSHFLYDYFL